MMAGVEEMVDSIHDELRKPSEAAAQTSKIAAKLRSKKQRSSLRRKAELVPIGANFAFDRFRAGSPNYLILIWLFGGPDRDRTDDLFHAMEARSQLRHRPTCCGDATFLLSPLEPHSSNFRGPAQATPIARANAFSFSAFSFRPGIELEEPAISRGRSSHAGRRQSSGQSPAYQSFPEPLPLADVETAWSRV